MLDGLVQSRKVLVGFVRWLELGINPASPPSMQWAHFVISRFAVLPLQAIIFLFETPIELTHHPRESFLIFSQLKDGVGFMDSYAEHLRRYRLSVATSVLLLLFMAGQVSYLAFSLYDWVTPQPAVAATIDISGTVYLNNEATTATTINGGFCDSATSNLSVRVNGGAETTTTCSSSNGTYAFTGITANAGDTITLYSTASQKANRVYVSDATNDTGQDLYITAMAVGDENDGTLNITDLVDYDSDQNDTDMLFDAEDAAPDTLSVESGNELHVHTGDTFDPDGDVTVNEDLHVPSSAVLNIDSGFTTVLVKTSGTALTLVGTIQGVGTLSYASSASFPTGGTMSAYLRADATTSTLTLAARTFGGTVECYSNSASNHDCILGTAAQTTTISGNFYVTANNTGNVRILPQATTDISGDVDFLGTGGGVEQISWSQGTMNVAGNFDYTDGTSAGGSTGILNMTGSGKKL